MRRLHLSLAIFLMATTLYADVAAEEEEIIKNFEFFYYMDVVEMQEMLDGLGEEELKLNGVRPDEHRGDKNETKN